MRATVCNFANTLGYLLEEASRLPGNVRLAFVLYRWAARRGDAFAQANLARLYHEGKGVARRRDAAMHWFGKAAEQGHSWAQNMLACAYLERDLPGKALYWYEKAASESGYAPAQFNLGWMYEEGIGTDVLPSEARKYYLQAARELPEAQYNLALMYFDGRGGPRNEKVAREWLQKAAASGLEQARELLSGLR